MRKLLYIIPVVALALFIIFQKINSSDKKIPVPMNEKRDTQVKKMEKTNAVCQILSVFLEYNRFIFH